MSKHTGGAIVLIGPMAAGKSWLGRGLSTTHGYTFVDADEYIVARHGEIPTIFAEHGEAYFRDLEVASIEAILSDPEHAGSVVSLGGGAPMSARVRELISDHTVIYLRVDAETVRPRIVGNSTRPLLQPDPVSRWNQMFEQRRSTYEALADVVVDASGPRDVAELVGEIHDAIQHSTQNSGSAAAEAG
ncbi:MULTISPECIES: shikimate kinase [Micrococcales]|uniref:shikimate kinase n=1 Tax=Micrococcales TaxID=85006 RepID=UPI0004AB003C|nr:MULTISPECIES: shikimate kinase [Micrococcales]